MIMLDMTDKRPIYEQITEKVKDLIVRNILQKNEQLPSVRALAIELSINPNTIQRAYSELERTGYIFTVKGKGNFVADVSDLLPSLQSKYYKELDEVLAKAQTVSLSQTDILSHIEKYYKN